MKKFMKVMVATMAMVLMLSFAGCAKVVSTETVVADVTVVDTYHSPSVMLPRKIGKVRTFYRKPEVNKVYVEKDGIQYYINDETTYKALKDKVGETVTGTFIITSYDNGKTKTDIISLN